MEGYGKLDKLEELDVKGLGKKERREERNK